MLGLPRPWERGLAISLGYDLKETVTSSPCVSDYLGNMQLTCPSCNNEFEILQLNLNESSVKNGTQRYSR